MRAPVLAVVALGIGFGAYACGTAPNSAVGGGGAAQSSTGYYANGTTDGGCTHQWEVENDACCPEAPCCGLDGTAAAGCGTTSAGPTPCDSIGVCESSNPTALDPTKGCYDCVLTPGMMFTDEGSCVAAESAAYGSDGKCTMGGVQGACDFVACSDNCFANDPMGQLQASWDCYCTNNEMGAGSTCNDMPSLKVAQTDTKTCLGALVANSAAYQAETYFEACWEDACFASCSTPASSSTTSSSSSAQSSATSTSTASASTGTGG